VTRRVVVLPPVPALLPEYAGQVDPVPTLRAACRSALAWACAGVDRLAVLADPPSADDRGRGVTEPLGVRVARALAPVPVVPGSGGPALAVAASGSACRGEKAPGHLDERSFDADARLGAALAAGDAAALGDLDVGLGDDLLAYGWRGLARLAPLRVTRAEMDHADDPFGVQYWVVRWTCES
jgi:hypothetical protein